MTLYTEGEIWCIESTLIPSTARRVASKSGAGQIGLLRFEESEACLYKEGADSTIEILNFQIIRILKLLGINSVQGLKSSHVKSMNGFSQ